MIDIDFDSDKAFQKVCDTFGGHVNLANSLDISVNALKKWASRGVPANRVPELVRRRDYQLLPSVIRPDLYPEDILKAEFEKVA